MEQHKDTSQEKAEAVLPYLNTEELLQAKTQIFDHLYGIVGYLSIKSAMDLDIPDTIDSHGGGPMTLSELSAALPRLHPSKVACLPRLMRLLTQMGYFATKPIIANDGNEEGYVLTPMSKLLVKRNPSGLANFAQFVYHPFNNQFLYHLSDWLSSSNPTIYHEIYGKSMWETLAEHPEMNHLFNAAMASDSSLEVQVLVRDCADVFKGFSSLLDVGGGTGTVAREIAKAFPRLKCMVLDLPHVVATVPETGDGVAMIAGDMFERIPPADIIFLKWILHDWNDDDCVRILKKCREAVLPSGGKVVAIDMVVGHEKSNEKLVEGQLFHDICMMMHFMAVERDDEEWRSIISRAGFSRYTIKHVLGVKSLIEMYTQ